MQARMKNPAYVLPDAMTGVRNLYQAMYQGGAPAEVLELVHLRASQINGCSACVDAGIETSKKAGVTDEQLNTVAVWREAPYFSDAERAALALTEAATRLADGGSVSEDVWDAVAVHFDEPQLSAIILMIAVTNMFNRMNAIIREPAGARWD